MNFYRPYSLKRMPHPTRHHTYPAVTLALKMIARLIVIFVVALIIVLAPIFKIPT